MGLDDIVAPTASAPPATLTEAACADLMSVTVARLREWVALGCLPSPLYIDGKPRYPLSYPLQFRCDGLRLIGTYEVIAPVPPVTLSGRTAPRKPAGGTVRKPSPGKGKGKGKGVRR